MIKGKTIHNSRNPIIKESLKLHAPLKGPLGSVTIAVYSEEPAGGEQADILIGAATFDVDAVLAERVSDSLVHDAGPLHKWLDLSGGKSGSIHVSLGVEEVRS